ncbi:hypothetical protein JW707_02985 [Candidatus Woesearchaeota archaeon]|nr:hypothetical protein [Candidatus Woesearchaeota archaeon]
MVFGWFSKDSYQRVNEKLEELRIFEQLEAKDLDKEKLGKAKQDASVLEDELDELIKRFNSSYSEFYNLDADITIQLQEIIVEITVAIKHLPAIKDFHDLIEEGGTLAGLESELEKVKNALKIIDGKIKDAETIVSRLQAKAYPKKKKEEEKTEKKKVPMFPLKPRETIFEREFSQKLVQYSSLRSNIDTKMTIIENTPNEGKMHDRINHGRYQGLRHAHVTRNLIIIYDFNFGTRVITYVTIMTKNEFDKS